MPQEIQCKYSECDVVFPKNGKRLFCSIPCRDKYHAKNKRNYNPTTQSTPCTHPPKHTIDYGLTEYDELYTTVCGLCGEIFKSETPYETPIS